MGDFNCACSVSGRAQGGEYVDRGGHLFNNIADKCNLLDVGNRETPKEGTIFTHFQGASRERLDRIYLFFEPLDSINT